ncbi:MAG: N-acetylmuramoyl-L-alanine amidase [Kordiimonadaceae bacterium]|nr:N-acetylmuramoyl-L-alanine amidase [Kordiimonadaceae bacterium]
MQTAAAALDRLCDASAKVSSHYLIDEDGTCYALVPDENRAWHSGVSSWRGVENVNHASIGIELVNPGHEFGYRAFPDAQIDRLLDLLTEIAKRHPIKPGNYIGHSDIAPDRKRDPGELFPWVQLAAAGFGLWSDKDGSSNKIIAKRDEISSACGSINKQLGAVGYAVADSLVYDRHLECALSAFQAHWRPSSVTGCFDEGTALILNDIALQIVQIGKK